MKKKKIYIISIYLYISLYIYLGKNILFIYRYIYIFLRKISFKSRQVLTGSESASPAIANPEEGFIWDISVSCKQNKETNDGVAKKSVRGACCVSKELRWFGERAGLRMFSTESRQKKKKIAVLQIKGGPNLSRWIRGGCRDFPATLFIRNSSSGRR